jgi:hypothetical protein
MAALRTIAGRGIQGDHPDWKPLLDLVGPVLVRWFMWMYEIALADGTPVHAYKHVATRRYLHLAAGERAFAYTGRDRYREIDTQQALEAAFCEWEELLPEPDRNSLNAYEALMRQLAAG